MSDPVDPQSPPQPPTEPEPIQRPPTANEPVFAEPAATSWAATGDVADRPTGDDVVVRSGDDESGGESHGESGGGGAGSGDGEVDDADYPVVTTVPWVSLVSLTGLGLSLIVVLEVIVFIAQGLAGRNPGISPLLRMGSGFFNSLDSSQLEILLILATLLLVLPAIGEQATTERQDRSAALGLALTSAFAVIVGVAAVVAVLFELKSFHLQSPGQALPSPARRLLIGYLIRHVGLSLIALLASIAAMRARFAPPAEVAGEVDVIGAA